MSFDSNSTNEAFQNVFNTDVDYIMIRLLEEYIILSLCGSVGGRTVSVLSKIIRNIQIDFISIKIR